MNKGKRKVIDYQVGDDITLTLIRSINNQGKRPIARAKDGRLCLIDFETKGFWKYNTTWLCEVKEVHENKLIIIPKMEIRDQAEERELTESMTKDLASKYAK
jgi:hypothetical protein